MKYLFYLFLLAYISATCYPEDGPADLHTNSPYYICLILNGNERSVFSPVVDQYGRFVYKDRKSLYCRFDLIVYNKVKERGNTPTYIQLAIGTKDEEGNPKEIRSVPKLFNGLKYQDDFFTFMTAVITAEKGVIKSIDWDNGCYSCMTCEENSVLEEDGNVSLITNKSPYYRAYQGKNCVVKREECDNNTNCDLTIYLVWSGSDIDGRVFQSANLRMSRFQSGSIESIVNTLPQMYNFPIC